MSPLEEDFARWRQDPMTRRVLAALENAVGQQQRQWLAASWGGGVVRGPDLERLLLELRVRADAYRALGELTPADIEAWLEPEKSADADEG